MRVLVTGAAGFVGGTVVTALLDAEHEVQALDVLLPAAHGPVAKPPAHLDPRAPLLRADVRDAAALEQALQGVDAVCHQAALVGLGVDLDDRPDDVGVNDSRSRVREKRSSAAVTWR